MNNFQWAGIFYDINSCDTEIARSLRISAVGQAVMRKWELEVREDYRGVENFRLELPIKAQNRAEVETFICQGNKNILILKLS